MQRIVKVAVIGAGLVGCEVLRQIVSSRTAFANRLQCRVVVTVVADSRSFVLLSSASAESNDAEIEALLRTKASTGALPKSGGLPPTIGEALQRTNTAVVVDATATSATEALLSETLARGGCVVLANKVPVAAAAETAAKYFATPRARFESTVCGGDPLLATLRRIQDGGERVVRVCGALSGSLSFVFRCLDDGAETFSAAVEKAKRLGYTEPNPREDLCGADVRRKLVVLARTCGAALLEQSDVAVEDLCDVNDADTERRRAAAHARGCVLRYIAAVDIREDGHATASAKVCECPLKSIDATLGSYAAVTTAHSWPAATPLVLTGAGAGAAMTAAGVLGDIGSLVREGILPAVDVAAAAVSS